VDLAHLAARQLGDVKRGGLFAHLAAHERSFPTRFPRSSDAAAGVKIASGVVAVSLLYISSWDSNNGPRGVKFDAAWTVPHLQFRLRTLLLLVTLAGIGAFLCLRVIRPNVGRVEVTSSGVVVFFSDACCRWMGVAHYDDESGQVVWPGGEPDEPMLLRDPYIVIGWAWIIIGLVSLVLTGLIGCAYFRSVRTLQTPHRQE
jgi:hypothetical protein